MPWSIYSPEDFPKWDKENNHWVDYRQSLGVQVLLRAHQWTELDDFYKHTRYESWIDAAGDGKESVVSGKEVALRMAGDFRLRGIRSADLGKISEEEKTKLIQEADAANLKFRRMFVDRFEQQFREKQNGGMGRWTPNPYEQECYDLLGLRPPQVVQQANAPSTAPVVIQQQVDPEMLQQLVAQEVARLNAEAQKKPRTI